ncbi:YihY/virulence factor BrkB family protein [Yinghuangia soli]|uniref:YihY/virulence factor BrkB family protein n=1 Tax=Yinghuangia soli TaxID=2908204 RepID=A0AA41PVQ0_9ACTN|nr:YihY/virulence factor BrkB family protein [Yinghuangia soli]MCF2526220.1 YihY/virulence factor BrkB family protein [Yinghuangia soli]
MAADKKVRTPVRGPGRIRLRSALWRIVRETFMACYHNRVTGLAAEAGFFMLLSLPPLLLGLAGTIGYLQGAIGQDTIDGLKQDIIDGSGNVLSQKSVDQVVVPLVNDVFASGRADIISVGFVIALWSGSRALNVYVDTITIMYGLDGKRGIVKTRLLSFGLYVVGLVLGMFLIPLLLAGPELVVKTFPHFEGTVHILYWPVLVVMSVCFLTTLYHVSVPVRTPWREDIPGALVALLLCILGSFLLRVYLATTVDGPSVYGSLAAPVAVLVWMYFAAMAILIGAAMNAAIDQVWPSQETAQARAEAEKERAAAEIATAMAAVRRAGKHRGLPEDWDPEAGDDTVDLIAPDEGSDGDEPPAEFPERWANYQPPRGNRPEGRNGAHRLDAGSPPVQLPAGQAPPGLSLDEQLWPPVRPGGGPPDERTRHDPR